jgi:DNA repair photolyase
MRWDELKVESEAFRELPGYRDPATVRTFDAPEALDVRFYEVRAKSVLNRVPEQSRMPFRWTINPYRGCTHACKFCLRGDTPILMADGRTRPIAEVQPGDAIYGTLRDGTYRYYTITRVLAHWSTRKHFYRVGLEDGTELFASGDHRFLTNRGWKHVAGSERARWRRPHLTLNNKLIGTGGFAAPPAESADYRRGYVSGIVRGDGHVGYRSRGGQTSDEIRHMRLALVDLEAIARTKAYLAQVGVSVRRYAFRAEGGLRPMEAISTCLRDGAAHLDQLLHWPRQPSDDWCKGFLAGIFDAEGGFAGGPGGGIVRIANTDPALIDWTTYCLRRFGFSFVVERPPRRNGLRYVRLLGGLPAQMRFFHACDPAITRKRTITETALKSTARLKVVSIERMGISTLYDITTGSGDFIANGVVSHNCFARPTHKYLDLSPGRDFEREIVVKVNAPEVARAELSRPRWKREHVAMGTNTDPYQWVESKYKLMPGILEALRDTDTPASVLTKSPLLLRDMELLKQVPDFQANLSVPTLEETAWRSTEPHTPHPRKRLEAVAELNRNGIPCGVLIAPLIPGINDSPEQVNEIIEIATEAGATSIGGIGLHLRGEVKEIWFDWLRTHRPDLVPMYERLYQRGAYLPVAERERLSALARGGSPRRRWLRGTDPGPGPEPADAGPAEPAQGSLF